VGARNLLDQNYQLVGGFLEGRSFFAPVHTVMRLWVRHVLRAGRCTSRNVSTHGTTRNEGWSRGPACACARRLRRRHRAGSSASSTTTVAEAKRRAVARAQVFKLIELDDKFRL
jgi:hypothetical protein